jgi:hypothetical protein
MFPAWIILTVNNIIIIIIIYLHVINPLQGHKPTGISTIVQCYNIKYVYN